MFQRPALLPAFLVALVATWSARSAAAQEGDAPPVVKPFVQVPAGQVLPGCTEKDYKDRHRGNGDLKRALLYDIWGAVPPFPLAASPRKEA